MLMFANFFSRVCYVALLLGSMNVLSADFSFVVRDQFGEPLKDAVIEFKDQQLNHQDNLSVAVMDQVDKHFTPKVLVIQNGQLVDFPNSDNIRHHVYSFSTVKQFDIKLYSGRPEKPEKFESPGIVVLGCNIHDSMVGYIYVADSSEVLKTSVDGKVQLNVSTFPASFTVWQPNQQSDIDQKKTITFADSSQVADIVITTIEPKPRNTFGEMFKGTND